MRSASPDSFDLTSVHPQFRQDLGEDFAQTLGSGSPLLPDPGQFLRQRDRFLLAMPREEVERSRRRESS